MVIMCGIAWGGDSGEQKIGDVLISTKVWEYDIAKVTEEKTIPRGNNTPASAQLIQAFETVTALDKKIDVRYGLIASGSLLLNKESVVQQLKTYQSELIGGDMEMAGVVSACERANKQWIMIKGICDWGFNKDTVNKEEDQEIAAENAASIVLDMLGEYRE